MERDVTLRIVLVRPPAGVDFGLQKGRGSAYETIQRQRSDGQDLAFELTVGLKEDRSASPNFVGPFVQGPSGGRFIYIDIGTCRPNRQRLEPSPEDPVNRNQLRHDRITKSA